MRGLQRRYSSTQLIRGILVAGSTRHQQQAETNKFSSYKLCTFTHTPSLQYFEKPQHPEFVLIYFFSKLSLCSTKKEGAGYHIETQKHTHSKLTTGR